MCPIFSLKSGRPVSGLVFLSTLALVLLAVPACRGSEGLTIERLFKKAPRFVNHPRPDLSVSMRAFEEAGCTEGQWGSIQCTDNSPVNALSCDSLRAPTDLFGGLDPALPIAECIVFGKWIDPLDSGEYFYDSSAGTVDDKYPALVRYVVFHQDRFRLVKNEDAFRELYAPIDSSEEALSYVLAVMNVSAYYGLKRSDRYEYFVGVVEDTHVEAAEDGYRLHLFRSNATGPSICDPISVSIVDVHISFAGVVRIIASTGAFQRPSFDPACKD